MISKLPRGKGRVRFLARQPGGEGLFAEDKIPNKQKIYTGMEKNSNLGRKEQW